MTNDVIGGPAVDVDGIPTTDLTNILFVRDDGLFAVAHIDNGGLAMTESGNNAAPNWTHVIPVA